MNNEFNQQDFLLKWSYFSENKDDLNDYYHKMKKDYDNKEIDINFKEYVEKNLFSEKSISYIDDINKEINKKIKKDLENIKKSRDYNIINKISSEKADLYAKEVLIFEKVPLDYVNKKDFITSLKNNLFNLISNPKVKVGVAAAGITLAAASGVGPVALSLIAVSRGASLWLSMGGAEKLSDRIDSSLNDFISNNNIENNNTSKYKKTISNILKNNKFKIGASIALGLVSMSATSVASAMTDISNTVFEIENGASRIITSSIDNNQVLASWSPEIKDNHYFLQNNNLGYTEDSLFKAKLEAIKDFDILNKVDNNFNSEIYKNNMESIFNEIKYDINSGMIDFNSMSEYEKQNYINGILESKGLEKDIKLDLGFDYKKNFDFHLENEFIDEHGVTHINLHPSEGDSYLNNIADKNISNNNIPPLAENASGNVYVVEKNDNLWKIARKTFEDGELERIALNQLPEGVSQEEIKKETLKILHNRVNDIIYSNPQIINPDLIYPNQEINIPKFNLESSLNLNKELHIIENTKNININSLNQMVTNDYLEEFGFNENSLQRENLKEDIRKYLNDKEYVNPNVIEYKDLLNNEEKSIKINDSVNDSFNKKFKPK